MVSVGRMESLHISTLSLYLVWGPLWLRALAADVLKKDNTSVGEAVSTPCWQVEEFVVSAECSQCNAFQLKSWAVCSLTGYVEKVNCPKSHKDEYKGCRSVSMEDHQFWRFEGSMMGLTVLFATVVTLRQRVLDRQASEKVRRQIESV